MVTQKQLITKWLVLRVSEELGYYLLYLYTEN